MIGQVNKDIGQVGKKIGEKVQQSLDQAQKDVTAKSLAKERTKPQPSQDDDAPAPVAEEKNAKTESVPDQELMPQSPDPNGSDGSSPPVTSKASDSVTPELPSKPQETLNE